MEIRPYCKERDEEKLMQMIEAEGEEWACYTEEPFAEKYRAALEKSITYTAYDEDTLCGYSRSIDDCGFYIYVCDLLVRPEYRGREIGRKLMECIFGDYPDYETFVMSDVDGYYQKLGYHKEGSIFVVSKGNEPV